MSIVIEIDDAENVKFNPEQNYPVLRSFNSEQLLGTARVSKVNGMLAADFKLTEEVTGYPAIGFKVHNLEDRHFELLSIAIADKPNSDEQIQSVTIKP